MPAVKLNFPIISIEMADLTMVDLADELALAKPAFLTKDLSFHFRAPG
jgi:hypothetical protein